MTAVNTKFKTFDFLLAIIVLFAVLPCQATAGFDPTPSVAINSGAAYTTSANVTLTLSCKDSGVDCAQVKITEDDNINCTNVDWNFIAAEAFSASKSYSFGNGDIAKYICVSFQDNSTNWSGSYSDSITLDITAPAETGAEGFETGDLSRYAWTTGGNSSWQIQQTLMHSGFFGAQAGTITHSQSTYLELTRSYSGAADVSFWYRVSSQATFDYLRFLIDNVEQGRWSGTGVSTFTKVNYPVSSGSHTYRWEYVKNASISQGSDTAWVDDIILPGDPVININSGAVYTASGLVTLSIAASDYPSGMNKMQFDNEGAGWSSLENYAATKSNYTLSSGDGLKTVNIRFTDNAGNVSSAYSDTITLDSNPPSTTAAASGYSFGSWTAASPVSVTLSASDATSGIAAGYPKYCVDTNNTCSPATTYSAFDVTCASGSTCEQYVRYQARDNAGNNETIKLSTVKQDRQLPADGTVTATPNDQRVSLSWSGFSDSGSGISSYKLVYQTGATAPADCSSGSQLYSGSGTTYNHNSLTNGQAYSYRVCAYDGVNNVSAGATATATPVAPAFVPDPPTGLGIQTMYTKGPALTWTASALAATYYIYRSTDNLNWGTPVGSVSHPSNSFTDTTAETNKKYYWTVTAWNVNGESSKPASVTGKTALLQGFNLISVPYNTTGMTPRDVFGTALCNPAVPNPATDDTNNCFFRTWVSSSNTDPDNSGAWGTPSEIKPGESVIVWIWNNRSVVDYTGAANGASVNVTLRPGWNLISNHSTTNMTNIKTNWLVDGLALSNAVSGGTIGGDIYGWNGNTYDSMNITTGNPTVFPWWGYWILNRDSASHTLTIQ